MKVSLNIMNASFCLEEDEQATAHYFHLARQNSVSSFAFEYQGLTFSQETFHLFAGLCAVDNETTVAKTMQILSEHGQVCTRMGAFKPRTSPYSFQGLGKSCLPYVFELAGRYGIKVIAMEVTHESQIEDIDNLLEKLGRPTGVILQVGTRNAQNFELLKALGRQQTYPILYKRGFGNTLSESIQAAEYIAAHGNPKIIFCLRGVKSHLSDPHRNFVDFAHIPVIKRLTNLSVCIDPSHSVGESQISCDAIRDIYHITAQGVIAGANMVLVDFHPLPKCAKVDRKQALPLSELPWYLEDIAICRETYLKRQALAQKYLVSA